jgi:hypothetical protein
MTYADADDLATTCSLEDHLGPIIKTEKCDLCGEYVNQDGKCNFCDKEDLQ